MKHTTRIFTIAALAGMLYRAAEPGVDGTGALPVDIGALPVDTSTQPPVKTAEQLAAEAAQAGVLKEQEKAAKKAAADQAKAEKKAAADQAKAQKKADSEAKKAELKAAKDAAAQAKKDAAANGGADKEAARVAKEAAKQAAKAAREAEKLANQMPEQNGVRRPKPATLCGQAWKVMDEQSMTLGAPVSISQVLTVTGPMGLVEGNVKAEYARWRKFNGVTGRVQAPAAAPAVNAEGVQTGQPTV